MRTLPSVPKGAEREAGGGAQVSNRCPTATKLNASRSPEEGPLLLCWALLAHPGLRTSQAFLAQAVNTQDLLAHLDPFCPRLLHPTTPAWAPTSQASCSPVGIAALPLPNSNLEAQVSSYPGGVYRQGLWSPPPGRAAQQRCLLLLHSDTVT